MPCPRPGRDVSTQQLQSQFSTSFYWHDTSFERRGFIPVQSIHQADYVVPVEIEYHWHNVYVIKRPGVDNFLKKMGEIYEIVVFTASLSKVRNCWPKF